MNPPSVHMVFWGNFGVNVQNNHSQRYDGDDKDY